MAKKTGNKLDKLDVKITDVRVAYGRFGDWCVYEVLINAINDTDLGMPMIHTIKGNFDRPFKYGEEFIVYANEVEAKFGKQYDVKFVRQRVDTPENVKAFLLQYTAEKTVNQLVDIYAGDVIKKIVSGDIDLSLIKGLGKVRFKSLQEKVIENEYMVEIVAELEKFGLTPNQIKRIAQVYGSKAVHVVMENPYTLCEVSGIGFKTADEIAIKIGYDMESPNRIQEAIKYIIKQAQLDGHTWIDRQSVIGKGVDLLQINGILIDNQIDGIEGVIVVDSHKVAMKETYSKEKSIAEHLKEMFAFPYPLEFDPIEYTNSLDGVTLTGEQQGIFHNLKSSRVSLVVGYAGCGKSYCEKVVLDLLDKLGLTSVLLAPTGKASKVMEQYTGRKAFTIHRRLGLWEGAEEAQSHIYDDVVIVDESSMADVNIMYLLLKYLSNNTGRIIIIGDDFQIPSVGEGNVLHDIIESNAFPTAKLTKVFRQAEGGILDVATKIRLKQKFIDSSYSGRQKYGQDMLIDSLPSAHIASRYLNYFEKALEKFKAEDIVILTPTKKGELGTVAINKAIQEMVNPANPSKREKFYGDVIFRMGDRIINTKNNYKAINIYEEETKVYNGDMGVIEDIDFAKQVIVVNYGFDTILTHFTSLDTISHAYCLTIHKSQGSAFPCVICIFDKAHKFQLNANLIYTAWTRAQRSCITLCQADVINLGMKKNANKQRNTFLKEFLNNA